MRDMKMKIVEETALYIGPKFLAVQRLYREVGYK
jgi:hypothetical protein